MVQRPVAATPVTPEPAPLPGRMTASEAEATAVQVEEIKAVIKVEIGTAAKINTVQAVAIITSHDKMAAGGHRTIRPGNSPNNGLASCPPSCRTHKRDGSKSPKRDLVSSVQVNPTSPPNPLMSF